MPIDEKYICKQCDAVSSEEEFSACSQCKEARYCSVKCQRIDWTEGGHRAICNGLKRDKEIISYIDALNEKIETLSSRVHELTKANTDLLTRVYELEVSALEHEEEHIEERDYIREYRETEPEYAPVEENSGYENRGCYGCELMMNGYTGTIYTNHHSCMRTTN
jgi:hypothetical protein